MKKGNIKIRNKERGTIRAYLIAKFPGHKAMYLRGTDKELVRWMLESCGYNHFKKWRYNVR